MATKKTRDDLAKVFDKFTEVMAEVLGGEPATDKDGNVVLDPEGNPVMLPPSPAMLGVVRQFLKDNRVEADPAQHAGLGAVANKFRSAPFPVDEDNDLSIRTVQ